jgi:uncharacterized protein involved in outer membrane biogenesis
MPLRRKIIITTAAALLFGLIFTAFILPIIVRNQLEKQINIATDRSCKVEKVYINPLNWSAEVVGVKLSEKKSGAAFVSFSSLRLSVSPASIWRMAPVVSGLKITSPYVHLQRTAPNSYNFTDILEKHPKKKSAEPARFSLNNILVENGRVVFDDDALSEPQRQNIEQLALQIPFISNISYFADKYVDPKLSAVVNGAPLSFAGKLKPFEKGLEATLDINLKGVNIPYYAAYFPEKLPVKILKGELSAGLRINHQLIQKGKPDINISGVLNLQNLAVAEHSGAHLLSLKSINIDIARIGLLNKRYEFAKMLLEAPELSLSGDRNGVWNLSRLKSREVSEDPDKKNGQGEKSSAPDIIITSLQLIDGVVNLKDERPPGGSSVNLKNISFSLNNFASKGDVPAAYTFSLVTGRKEKASASGNISMEPLALSSRINLSDIVLEAAYPYLATTLNDPVRGRAEFSGDLAFSADKGLTVEQAMLRVKDVKIPFGKSDGVSIPLLAAEGGSLKLKEKTLSLEKVTVSGGKVNVSRDAGGKLSTSLLLKARENVSKPRPAAAKQEKPFSWKIGRISINGVNASFLDASKEEQPKFELKRIKAEISSVKGPQLSEMPVSIAANIGAKGSVSIGGKLTPAPFRFKGDLNCSRFPFVDFEPYLPEGVNIALIDGKLDTRLSLDLSLKDGKPYGSFHGDGGVRDFYSVDAEEENDFLKWDSLLFESFNGTFEPFTLSMSGLSLNHYYARVIVNRNGRINLQDIYKPQKKQEPVPADSTGQQPPVKNRNIRIDTITLSDGILDFSDHHLNREFSTTMLNMGGRVSGLNSDVGSTADIDLRGNLENHSPLKISGRINPLANDLFLDMQINFSDIELSPLTPYSGTYLGYVIDKGKLSLAMNYKVEKKSLTAENKVFIDQFTFGDKVESGKATSLPVRLAVALLKDKNGEIHIDLPLSGRTDSPKFSIWGLVGQVLKNLLVKAATSPLALLTAGFGGGADFSSISFASGSSRLTSAEEVKLRTLAKALTERPGIRLEIMGFADRERDPEGYRVEMLHRKMKSEKILSLAKEKGESVGVKHDEVDILSTEESKWLKAVYEKEKFPKPRTVIGTLKSMPDSEMKKLILANTAVTEQQLRGLARERALSVMNFLLNDGKLPQERLFEKSSDPFAISDKGGAVGGRVEFGVVAR